jgi:hypothetical protein
MELDLKGLFMMCLTVIVVAAAISGSCVYSTKITTEALSKADTCEKAVLLQNQGCNNGGGNLMTTNQLMACRIGKGAAELAKP